MMKREKNMPASVIVDNRQYYFRYRMLEGLVKEYYYASLDDELFNTEIRGEEDLDKFISKAYDARALILDESGAFLRYQDL